MQPRGVQLNPMSEHIPKRVRCYVKHATVQRDGRKRKLFFPYSHAIASQCHKVVNSQSEPFIATHCHAVGSIERFTRRKSFSRTHIYYITMDKNITLIPSDHKVNAITVAANSDRQLEVLPMQGLKRSKAGALTFVTQKEFRATFDLGAADARRAYTAYRNEVGKTLAIDAKAYTERNDMIATSVKPVVSKSGHKTLYVKFEQPRKVAAPKESASKVKSLQEENAALLARLEALEAMLQS
jgi:hypothetical protein